MASHKWTAASRAKLSASLRARFAAQKVKRMTPKKLHDEMNKLAQPQDIVQQPAVDIPRLEKRAFRHGLIAAMECILRELR